MADKLSQNEIDALLGALRSGEKDLNSPSEANPETKYRKYDFSSPRKFTKDRIKMLMSIFDNYSRLINSRLNARLRMNCEITVESIEEQRYYEFSNALREGDVLGLIDAKIKNTTEDAPILFYLSTQTALVIMDRMMGSEDTTVEKNISDYTYTDLEIRLYEDIVQDLASVMGSSWGNYVPIEFSLRKVDRNPTLSQIIGMDEIVVIVNMNVKFADIPGRMSMCIPGDMLSNIFQEISRENPTRKAVTEDKTDDIFDNLRDSSLEIVAELGNACISLSDLYSLHVGDVIDLGCSKDSEVSLGIGGYKWFTGRVGTYEKNMAVRISEVYNQSGQRSE